jgi:hypothetical protein
MEEKSISPEHSLQIITRMMDEARSRFEENGITYLVWGTLSALAGLAHFWLHQIDRAELSAFPYLALNVIGLPFTFWYYRRKEKSRVAANNQIGNLVMRLWQLVVCNVIVLGFFFFSILGNNLIPLILLLLSLAICISGFALRSQLLIGAGLVVNVLGIAAFFVSLAYQPLLTSLAAVVAMIIPGSVLFYNDRKRKKGKE